MQSEMRIGMWCERPRAACVTKAPKTDRRAEDNNIAAAEDNLIDPLTSPMDNNRKQFGMPKAASIEIALRLGRMKMCASTFSLECESLDKRK